MQGYTVAVEPAASTSYEEAGGQRSTPVSEQMERASWNEQCACVLEQEVNRLYVALCAEQ